MSNPAKKRKPGRKTPPLSRAQLLPMAAALARDASLRAHIALATMRSGHGNVELMGELMKTVYLTYLLCGNSRSDLADNFAAGQLALNNSFAEGTTKGDWTIDAHIATALEPILLEHDAQLERRPLHIVEANRARLTRLLQEDRFPDLGKATGATPAEPEEAHVDEEIEAFA